MASPASNFAISPVFVGPAIALKGSACHNGSGRARKVLSSVTRTDTGMKLREINIEKTVKTLTGDEITRKGKVSFPLPENHAEALALYGDNLWKWAVQGASIHLRVTGSNAIAGGDPKLKALRRQFTQSFETLTKIMELSKDDALKMLVSKETFKPLVDEIEALKNADKPVDIVFAEGSIPEPRWFTGEGDEEEGVDPAEVSTETPTA